MPPEDPPEPIQLDANHHDDAAHRDGSGPTMRGVEVHATEVPAGGDYLAQERAAAAQERTSWQPYQFQVTDFEVVPDTLRDFGSFLVADGLEFMDGFKHGLGQAMNGLPNFGMSGDGALPDGDALTTAYFPAFEGLARLMGDVTAGLATLGQTATGLSLKYSFADGDAAEMLDAVQHSFGETTLWGNDREDPHNLDRLQQRAEREFRDVRQDLRDGEEAGLDVAFRDLDGDGEPDTENVPVGHDEAATNATERAHDQIREDVDQQRENNERFPAGDWDSEGHWGPLVRDPVVPENPPTGHPAHDNRISEDVAQ